METCEGMSNLLSSVGLAIGALGIGGAFALILLVIFWADHKWG